MVVYQYCNKCKTEQTHELKDSVLLCKKCLKETKLKKEAS